MDLRSQTKQPLPSVGEDPVLSACAAICFRGGTLNTMASGYGSHVNSNAAERPKEPHLLCQAIIMHLPTVR